MITKSAQKQEARARRHGRVRAKISGTPERPRLAVFKSNKYVYAQLIDDQSATTLASFSSQGDRSLHAKPLKEQADVVGKKIAELAKAKNIESVVFDRGGFLFTGVVQKVADSAREAGLTL